MKKNLLICLLGLLLAWPALLPAAAPLNLMPLPDIRPDVEGRAKYWTTNPVGTLDLYWNFDFVDGQPDGNTRGILLAVRLVRSGH